MMTAGVLHARMERFIGASPTHGVPEIILIPVSEGSAGCLRWIDDATAE